MRRGQGGVGERGGENERQGSIPILAALFGLSNLMATSGKIASHGMETPTP